MLNKFIISLGSNQGNRMRNLSLAVDSISDDLGDVIAKSKVYKTESWGYKDVYYYNAVLCLISSIEPLILMDKLLEIEIKLGRQRKGDSHNYESRTIDLDILLIEGLCVNHHKLKVPHPRMHLRKFILLPLQEIAPEWKHEVIHKTISELLQSCEDELDVIEVKDIQGEHWL